MKTEKLVVKQNPEEEIATEVLAEAIVKLSDGMTKLLSTGLNRRALLVLLKASVPTVPVDGIDHVLNALSDLKKDYTLPKKE